VGDWQKVQENARCHSFTRLGGHGAETFGIGRLDEDSARAMTAVFDGVIATHGRGVVFFKDRATYTALVNSVLAPRTADPAV
jgi:hypothetical protein